MANTRSVTSGKARPQGRSSTVPIKRATQKRKKLASSPDQLPSRQFKRPRSSELLHTPVKMDDTIDHIEWSEDPGDDKHFASKLYNLANTADAHEDVLQQGVDDAAKEWQTRRTQLAEYSMNRVMEVVKEADAKIVALESELGIVKGELQEAEEENGRLEAEVKRLRD